MKSHYRISRVAGFTLTELMVTIVIGSVLLAVAVPSYMSQTRKARRTQARTAVLDLAGREERFFSANSVYTDQQAYLAYGPDQSTASVTNVSVGDGYYTVSVQATAPDPTTSPPTAAAYTIVATAAGSQAADTQCTTFQVTQTGLQQAFDASKNDTTSACWH